MKYFTLILLLTAFIQVNAQSYNIGFYNVENLFDTIDDPHKNDNEFLPSAKKNWNTQKYNEKISHINQVINYVDSPLAFGFCELENRKVLEDIISSNTLIKKYQIIHYESSDERGIDVGMIYNPEKLHLISSSFIRFTLPGKEKPSSRDIVWGKFAAKKDTLFILVNHWPSRIGGEEKTDTLRMEAAKNARKFIDSIQLISPESSFILMGDLNDYPSNKAPKLIGEKLTPMITYDSGEFKGTHEYQKHWEILDHIFVSPNLLGRKKIKVLKNSGKIHSPSFLIEEYKGLKQPLRTYASSKYLGGYSDHLPVSIKIKL